MKTLKILIPLVLVLLLAGCSLFSAPEEEQSGIMQYYTADSTGTERDNFHVGEPVFVHFKMINPTNNDISYKRYPWYDDSVLFYYAVCAPGFEVIDPIGFPPQGLKETYLPKHESREQVYKIEGLEVNEHSIVLQLFVFVNPKDFKKNYNWYLHIKVEE